MPHRQLLRDKNHIAHVDNKNNNVSSDSWMCVGVCGRACSLPFLYRFALACDNLRAHARVCANV